jgi:hypothetical protein
MERRSSPNTDFNTYRAAAYISHERGPWFVQGDCHLAGMIIQTRHILFPGIDRSVLLYSGQDYTAMTTGYHFCSGFHDHTACFTSVYAYEPDNYKETGLAISI